MVEESGSLMGLFNRRGLRASYRNVPMDNIMALLSEATEQEDAYIDTDCLHRPLRKFRLKVGER